MVKHPKNKGNAFEILVYKDMKTYIDNVKRVSGSGVMKGENGDIIAVINNMQYCIEIKHYKTLTFALVDKWWEKIKRQSKEIGMSPLLIYRQNRQKIMIRTLLRFNGSLVVGDMKYGVWKRIIKNEVKK